MLNSLTPFLIQWAVTALSLWVASYLFKGLRFEGSGSLVVAALVRGFKVSGFWTAFFASIFISLFSTAVGALVDSGNPATQIQLPQGSGNWL